MSRRQAEKTGPGPIRKHASADLRAPPDGESSFRSLILEAARVHVRRFGEQKTNVVDIAKALGTSHTTIYRHFPSKAEIFEPWFRRRCA